MRGVLHKSGSMNTHLYITRHGLSEHNLNTEVFMGRSPASRLVEQGRAQARALGVRLAEEGRSVGRIICSSLPRTVETAELISEKLGGPPPQPEDAFWELSKGSWEGVMPRDPDPENQAALAADPYGFRYPGGESYRDVEVRVGAAFERWMAVDAAGDTLLVLHGDVIRALLRHLLKFPPDLISRFEIEPCSLSEFRRQSENYTLVRFNDHHHLRL